MRHEHAAQHSRVFVSASTQGKITQANLTQGDLTQASHSSAIHTGGKPQADKQGIMQTCPTDFRR